MKLSMPENSVSVLMLKRLIVEFSTSIDDLDSTIEDINIDFPEWQC